MAIHTDWLCPLSHSPLQPHATAGLALGLHRCPLSQGSGWGLGDGVWGLGSLCSEFPRIPAFQGEETGWSPARALLCLCRGHHLL